METPPIVPYRTLSYHYRIQSVIERPRIVHNATHRCHSLQIALLDRLSTHFNVLDRTESVSIRHSQYQSAAINQGGGLDRIDRGFLERIDPYYYNLLNL